MSAAHTPGPWIACGKVGLQIPVASVAMEGLKLNVAHVAGIRNGKGEANARLIAAAPELAATLAAVADFWAGGDAPPELEQRIYAALRAAGVRP